MHSAQLAMPPRLTLREIQARRQRAEEGIARFGSLREHSYEDLLTAMQGGIRLPGTDLTMAVASFHRRAEEIRGRMAAAGTAGLTPRLIEYLLSPEARRDRRGDGGGD